MPTVSGAITPDGGALVSILVGVSEARRNVLVRCGFAVPPPSRIVAVLDTGSFITLADVDAVSPLGVTAYDQREFLTSGTGTKPQMRPVYDLSVTVLDDAGAPVKSWPSVDVLSAVYPAAEVVHGVIGRDLLADCELHFDGKIGRFTLDL
jgi:hypothetical protein